MHTMPACSLPWMPDTMSRRFVGFVVRDDTDRIGRVTAEVRDPSLLHDVVAIAERANLLLEGVGLVAERDDPQPLIRRRMVVGPLLEVEPNEGAKLVHRRHDRSVAGTHSRRARRSLGSAGVRSSRTDTPPRRRQASGQDFACRAVFDACRVEQPFDRKLVEGNVDHGRPDRESDGQRDVRCPRSGRHVRPMSLDEGADTLPDSSMLVRELVVHRQGRNSTLSGKHRWLRSEVVSGPAAWARTPPPSSARDRGARPRSGSRADGVVDGCRKRATESPSRPVDATALRSHRRSSGRATGRRREDVRDATARLRRRAAARRPERWSAGRRTRCPPDRRGRPTIRRPGRHLHT